jgi:CHAT domain-containing protein/tetratricopeptide (TPR) repeat protein
MVRVDVGTLYASLGDLDRALESFQGALALLPEGSAARGAALTQIGNVYLRAGLPRRALFRFKQALASGDSASALNGMSLAWQRLGKPSLVLPLFQRSLALLDTPSEKATVWCNIGRLHLSLGQPRSAMDAFERALSLGDREARGEALSGMARVARMQGDRGAAKRLMEEALDVIESLRSDMGQPMPGQAFLVDLLKATYLASRQDDYAFLIDLLMERHRLEPDRGYDIQALEVNERALARSLSDSLGTGSEPWPSLLDTLLDDDTALLEYSLGEERSFLWWVTRTGSASFELPGRPVLEAAARRLHGLMSRRRASQAAVRHQSLKVAQLLLGPVAPRLSQRRLLIVAPDILQYVPFGTLPNPDEPLIARHEVIRSPSVTVLARLRTRSGDRERPRDRLALLGDAVFSELDDRLPPATRMSGEWSEPRRLPYVDDEVRSVLGRAGGEEVLAATGFEAVREVVLRGALGSFSILHFATHGMTDPKRPERSALLLSRFDRRGRPLRGWLNAEEIRELDLTADLVVLSACRTGLGREVRGEGLVGLSHSFLAAGASGVVMSLWNVDDRATAALMERFYRELLDRGRPPAEALRLAQLSLRDETRWKSPYYWGGFVLQGDWLNNARSGGSS